MSFRYDWELCPEGEVIVEIYDQTGLLFAGNLSFSNFWPIQSTYDMEDGIQVKSHVSMDELSVAWK